MKKKNINYFFFFLFLTSLFVVIVDFFDFLAPIFTPPLNLIIYI